MDKYVLILQLRIICVTEYLRVTYATTLCMTPVELEKLCGARRLQMRKKNSRVEQKM